MVCKLQFNCKKKGRKGTKRKEREREGIGHRELGLLVALRLTGCYHRQVPSGASLSPSVQGGDTSAYLSGFSRANTVHEGSVQPVTPSRALRTKPGAEATLPQGVSCLRVAWVFCPRGGGQAHCFLIFGPGVKGLFPSRRLAGSPLAGLATCMSKTKAHLGPGPMPARCRGPGPFPWRAKAAPSVMPAHMPLWKGVKVLNEQPDSCAGPSGPLEGRPVVWCAVSSKAH